MKKLLQSLLSALFSRTFLVLFLFAVFALLVWFFGPQIGLGGFTPLAAVGVRVTLIVLTLSLILFWLLHWPVSLVGATALCLMLWYGAPLISVGGRLPFAAAWPRLLLIGLIAAVFLVYFGFRFRQAMQANEALLRKLLRPKLGALDSPAKAQLAELQGIVGKALAHLRGLRTGVGGLRRILHGRRYIYELPWYIIIGAPGTGKTTAIQNSGLRFPLAEQLGTASLAGVSGTRNCVWWFTNDAVLIDTAGRYTTHETNAEVDSAEWKGFLRLLRKHRSRAPINGAILTVSVEELLARDEGGLTQLAVSLRGRLLELQRELGIRFPVYLMVTKMDRLKGFEEYFHQLSREGRRQTWGFTLPYEETPPRRTLKATREKYEGELRLLAARLAEGLPSRLREEFSLDRRRELYSLPGEFESLFEPLLRLTERVFLESRYESSQVQTGLRGIYFTSAAQGDPPLVADTTTILQRLKDFVTSEWKRPPQPAAPGAGQKSFFLQDVLQKVIFPEASLVKPNTTWERRLELIRRLGHLLVLIVGVSAAGAMLNSRTNNLDAAAILTERVGQARESLATANSRRQAELWPFVLSQICSLTEMGGYTLADPPGALRAGLFSLGGAAQAADRACRGVRARVLLPQAAAHLEGRLRAAASAAAQAPQAMERDMALYEALRNYLRLFSADPAETEKLTAWFLADLQARPAAHFLAVHKSLPEHLRLALQGSVKTPALEAAGLERKAELISQAREHLLGLTREERLYALVTAALRPQAPADFVPARHLEADGMHILRRAGGRSLTEGLPGLYTYDGYHQVFLPGLKDLLPALREEDGRIMADAPAPTEAGGPPAGGAAEPDELAQGILRLYYEDYTTVWGEFLEDVTAASGLLPESYLNMLDVLSGPDSPLEKLARAAARETALSAAGGQAGAAGVPAGTAKSAALAGALREAIRPRARMDELSLVDIHFSSFRRAVTDSTDPQSARADTPPDSQTFKELRELFGAYAAHMREVMRAGAARALPPPSDVPDKLLAKAAQLPPFFSTVLTALARGGLEREGRNRGQTLTQITENQLAAQCRRTLEGRYPFNAGGRDAAPADIAALLGPGGAFDVFFQTYLEPLVEKGEAWAYHVPAAGAPDLAPFVRAAALQQLLFAGPDPKNWGLSLEVSVLEMDPRIERADIVLGESVLSYDHGPVVPVRVDWNGAAARAVAEITLRPRTLKAPNIRERGSWAILRLFSQAKAMTPGDNEGQFWFEFDLGGHSLTLEVTAPGDNPLDPEVYAAFLCPRAAP